MAQQVVTHHHQRQPGGAQVFLCAAKCQAQFGPVHRARGHMGRKVNHQRCVTAQGLEVGQGLVFDAIDRLVRANMHIFGITAQLPTGGVGQAGVAGGGIAGGGVNGAVTARLLQRLLAPTAGDDKVCGSALRQVQRHDGVFSQTTALHEQNLKVIRHRQQLTQVSLRLFVNGNELFAPVAHFHDAHATAMPVQHLCRGFGQHFLRHGCRSSGEVKRSVHHAIYKQIGF